MLLAVTHQHTKNGRSVYEINPNVVMMATARQIKQLKQWIPRIRHVGERYLSPDFNLTLKWDKKKSMIKLTVAAGISTYGGYEQCFKEFCGWISVFAVEHDI